MAEVWRICIMPDHIHLLIRVKESLPEGKHLGTIVRGFKTGCTRAWWAQNPIIPIGEAMGTAAPAAMPEASPSGIAAVPEASPSAAVPEASPSGIRRPVLFQKGYHDRITNRPGMLENIKRYMAENPLRARFHHLNDLAKEICTATEMRIVGYSHLK